MYNFTLLAIDASKYKRIPWESFLMKTHEFPFSTGNNEIVFRRQTRTDKTKSW